MAESNINKLAYHFQATYPETGMSRASVETELAQMLTKLDVVGKMESLRGSNAEIVIKGISDLWKIKHLGGSVEENDRQIIGGVKLEKDTNGDEMRKMVNEELGHVEAQRGWYEASVKQLIDAGLSDNSSGQSSLIDATLYGPHQYVQALDKAGEEYRRHGTEVGWAKKGGSQATGYMDSQRPADMGTLKGILYSGLDHDLSNLRPVTPEE